MSEKSIDFVFKVKSYGVEEINDSLWLASLTYNGLTEIDRNSGKILNIYKYPDHPVGQPFLYSKAVLCGHWLVSIPFWSGDVAIFDIQSKCFKTIEIKKEYIGDEVGASLAAVAYENRVYIFPAGLRCIIKVDVIKAEISYITVGMEEILKRVKDNEIIFRQQYSIVEGKLLLGLATLGGYVLFDPQTENFDIRNIGETNGVVTVDNIDDTLYMAAWAEKKIFAVSGEGKIEKLTDFPHEYEFNRYAVAGSICKGKYIYYYPLYANMIVRFNSEKGTIDTYLKYYVSDSRKDAIITYFADETGFMTNDYEGIRVIEDNNGSLSLRKKMDFDVRYNASLISDYLIKNGYFKLTHETEKMDLSRFQTILTGKVGN